MSWMANKGHADVVRLLLQTSEAEVDSKDSEYRQTPLSRAAVEGHADVVKMLLEKGAEVDKQNNWGWTPLSYATRNGHTDVVKLLLEKGAEVNSDSDSKTRLSQVTGNGSADVVRILLKNGTEVDSEDYWGQTALDYAKIRIYQAWPWGSPEGRRDVVELLEE